MSAGWDPRRIPSQAGRIFVITGGNAGIGFHVAGQLAASGARIVIAARNAEKADAAIAAIRTATPGADVTFTPLDLASLDSVRLAAAQLATLDRIDGLVQNAAYIVGDKTRRLTADGFERHFGTNHLGHFALTAHLFPVLAATAGSRVVTLGSQATSLVKLRPDDLQLETRYSSFAAYAMSKHATQGFGFELDRRLRAAGSGVTALVAHPGGGQDGLSPRVPGINEPTALHRVGNALGIVTGGSKVAAAWPIVRAATDPAAEGGQYWGRSLGVLGRPVLGKPVSSSHSPEFGRRLWTLSEELTGIAFPM